MSSDLKKRILDSIENLTKLEIVTAVGKAAPRSGPDDADTFGAEFPEFDEDGDTKMIQTTIDLLRGRIRTVYDESFVTGEYQSLKNYHAAREKDGYNILRENIDTLERLLKMVTSHPK